VLALTLVSCGGKSAEQPTLETPTRETPTRETPTLEAEPTWGGPTCKAVAPDQRIDFSMPPTYTAETVIRYVVSTTCKRVVYSRRDAQREHSEPDPERCESKSESDHCPRMLMGSEIMTVVAEKLAPLGMTVIDRGEEAVFVLGTPAQPGPEPEGDDRIELDPNPPPGAWVEAPPIEGEPEPPFAVDLGCKDGTCEFDGAAVQAVLDDRSLRLRLIPNTKIAGGYKIYGLDARSFYWAAGLRNADTLVEIDGGAATTVLDGDEPVAALTELMHGLFERGGSVSLRLTSPDGVDRLVTLTSRRRR
jgi:hypothetical protein